MAQRNRKSAPELPRTIEAPRAEFIPETSNVNVESISDETNPALQACIHPQVEPLPADGIDPVLDAMKDAELDAEIARMTARPRPGEGLKLMNAKALLRARQGLPTMTPQLKTIAPPPIAPPLVTVPPRLSVWQLANACRRTAGPAPLEALARAWPPTSTTGTPSRCTARSLSGSALAQLIRSGSPTLTGPRPRRRAASNDPPRFSRRGYFGSTDLRTPTMAKKKTKPAAEPEIVPPPIEPQAAQVKTPPEPTPQPHPKAHLTDQEWLETLPLYGQLTGKALQAFSVDAIMYRRVREAQGVIAQEFRKARLDGLIDRKVSGKFTNRTWDWLNLSNPEEWKACPPSINGGCGDPGSDPSKSCKMCWGSGYTISRNYSPAAPPGPPPSPEVVTAILAGQRAGRAYKDLAEEFGVSRDTVKAIVAAAPPPPPKPKPDKPQVAAASLPPPVATSANGIPVRRIRSGAK